MLCQHCEKKPATVHITRIINGEKTELALCKDCAREVQQEWGMGIQSPFSFDKFLANILSWDQVPGWQERRAGQVACEQCGLTLDAFQQTGKFGCSACYEAFRPHIEPLLRRLHGNLIHQGKVPVRTGQGLRAKRELERLRRELQALVEAEEFEKAARVRDRIRELERKGEI